MAISKQFYGRGTGMLHPIDLHVGARVRMRRALLGMTQTDLANALGMSFQQVQKYENGVNRISASRLFELSLLFDLPVEYFFEDMPPEVAASSLTAKKRGKATKLPNYEPDPMTTRETMELVRSYYSIDDADVRKRLREMIAVLGAGAGTDS